MQFLIFIALLWTFFANFAQADDRVAWPKGSEVALKLLSEEYAKIPSLHVKFHYSAITGKDYSEYQYALDKLLEAQYSRKARSPRLADIKAGNVIAGVDGEYWGAPGGYAMLLTKGAPLDAVFSLSKASSVLFDGKSYLLKMDGDSYTALEADYVPAIASYFDALNYLPSYIPDRVMPLPTNGAVSYSELLKELSQDPHVSVKINPDGMTLDGFVRHRPGKTPSETSTDRVVVNIVKSGSGFAIRSVDFQTVEFKDGKEVLRYPASNIAFSDFVSVDGISLPKSILLTNNSSLADAGGNDLAKNSKITGMSTTELNTKVFSVITHKYSCDSIEVLSSPTPPSMKFQKGDVVFNRFTEDYIHIPENMSVSDISLFIDQAKNFPH